MTEEKIRRAAAVIVKGDLGEQTLVDYLKSLLETIWKEGEGFSGKRPFGNGGWEFDVYKALVKAELIEGRIDEDDDLATVNQKEGDELVVAVIKRLVIKDAPYVEEPMHQRMGL